MNPKQLLMFSISDNGSLVSPQLYFLTEFLS